MIKFNSMYSEKTKKPFICDKESKVQQNAKEECDINNIIAKYAKTGVLPEMIKNNPQYGDFSNAADYQTAMNTVITAKEQFNALPSVVRAKFENDPEKFLDFVHDPKNQAEIKKMGLTKNDDSNDEKPNTQPDPAKTTTTNTETKNV